MNGSTLWIHAAIVYNARRVQNKQLPLATSVRFCETCLHACYPLPIEETNLQLLVEFTQASKNVSIVFRILKKSFHAWDLST